jgi:hypothetical protein
MVLSEFFQMTAIIENLLLSWKNFKDYLKHNKSWRPRYEVEDIR